MTINTDLLVDFTHDTIPDEIQPLMAALAQAEADSDAIGWSTEFKLFRIVGPIEDPYLELIHSGQEHPLDLMVDALHKDPHLDQIDDIAEDSGEGRWTVNAAVDMGVPVPTIAASLFARFVSQQEEKPAMKMIAAMRNEFGGHAVVAAKPDGTLQPGEGGNPKGH